MEKIYLFSKSTRTPRYCRRIYSNWRPRWSLLARRSCDLIQYVTFIEKQPQRHGRPDYGRLFQLFESAHARIGHAQHSFLRHAVRVAVSQPPDFGYIVSFDVSSVFLHQTITRWNCSVMVMGTNSMWYTCDGRNECDQFTFNRLTPCHYASCDQQNPRILTTALERQFLNGIRSSIVSLADVATTSSSSPSCIRSFACTSLVRPNEYYINHIKYDKNDLSAS